MTTKLPILASDLARMNQWADKLVERIKLKLISPADREYEWFVHNLAGLLRGGDFETMTEVIEAAEQGADPVAHAALDLVFHEMLDAGEMPTAALRDYHRRVSGAPMSQRGRFSYEDYRRNIGFMALVRLTCQVFSLPASRNREQRRSQRPCGCSVIAEGLQRGGIDVSESRLTNLWGQQGKIAMLFVDAWQDAYLAGRVPK
jgi:hypothetical protein